MRSKKIWLLAAVLPCLAIVMLFHWSQGRAQQQAAALHEFRAATRFLEQPGQPLIAFSNDGASLLATQAPAKKLSEYMIGIDGSPVDDVLRAQLDLPAGQGVIVNQVVANSPAEKAGLKQYDVLLVADDKPISQIGDIANLIQEHKEAAITLKLIRSAKPLTIEVTPQRRPASQTGETCPSMSPLDDPEFVRRVYLDVLGVVPTADELNAFFHDLRDDKRTRLANELLRRSTIATKSCSSCHSQPAGHATGLDRWITRYDIGAPAMGQGQGVFFGDYDNDGRFDLYVANGPLAMTAQAAPSLPDDMTLTITRKGKEPARIQVTRDDQSWGTTENKVNELPEDIRGYVSPYFTTPRAVAVQAATMYGDLKAANDVRSLAFYKYAHGKTVPSTTSPSAADSDAGKPAAQTAPALADVEQQLKTLTQQIEQLQKTLEELRKSSAAPAPKPDGDPQP